MFPKPLTALKKENFVVNPVSNSAISLCASSTEFTYPKLSACLPSMVRDLKFSLCCFCLFLKNHGIYSFGCSATSLADFRESSVMFCKSLNIPSQSLSTEVVLVANLCLVQSAERPHRCPTLRMRSIDQTIDRQRFFLGSPTSRDRGKKEKGCARCVQILTLDN